MAGNMDGNMDGMADLAAAVVKELRAGDGDLEVYVVIEQDIEESSNLIRGDRYRLKPGIRNGRLKWDLHAVFIVPFQGEHHKGFKVVFDELDDVIAFIEGLNGCSLVIESDKVSAMFSMRVKKSKPGFYNSEKCNHAIKKFLMLCPKIEHCNHE